MTTSQFRNWSRIFAWGSIVLIGVWLISCAHVEAPSGGPPDKSAPRVSGIYPAQGATSVDKEFKAVIQFNEWINDRVNFRHAQISPPLESPLKVEAEGDKIFLSSRDTLAPNTTYTISLSNSIEDLRGNPMTQPFMLTFSTGPILDSLKLEGLVQNAFSTAKISPKTLVALYPLGEIRKTLPHLQKFKDTTELEFPLEPNFFQEPPMYKTGIDTLGYFAIPGLPPMKYRIIAFDDKNGNSTPELKEENVALFTQDIDLQSTFMPIQLSLTPMDTTGLSQVKVLPYRDNQLVLRFNRSPSWPTSSDTLLYTIYNSDSTWSTHPSSVFDLHNSPQVILKTNGLQNDSSYYISFPSLTDSLGRLIDSIESTQNFVWFTDTTPSQMLYSEPLNQSQGIKPTQNIHMFFDRITTSDDWRENLMLTINGDTVDFELKDSLLNSLVLKPAILPGSGAKVQVSRIYLDTVLQTNDSTQTLDTIFNSKTALLLSYQTWDPLKITHLQGSFPNCGPKTQLRLFNNYSEYLTTCDENQQFLFENIEVSKYFLEGFDDLNSNSIRDPGKIQPFEFPEPYFKLADTLRLKRDSLNLLDDLLTKENP